jgi:hypothetical protein
MSGALPIPIPGTFPATVIARLFNVSDRHVRRLAAEGIIPKAARNQYPLAGAVRGYITYLQGLVDGIGSNDPDRLPPFQRRAHYQSELEKLKLEQERGELIPRMEVEQQYALLLKIVAECLDTLPDLLERDCGLSAKVLVRVEAALDRAREDLHARLSEPDAETDDARAAGEPR